MGEPVKKPILYGGRFAGLNQEYSREYSFGSAESSSTSGRVGLRVGEQCGIFRRRVWATSISDEADSCTSELVLMSSTLWNDQNLFLTTLKIRIYPKTLLFSDERGSDTNCWWEKPLVAAGDCGSWWLVAFLDLLGASGLSLIFNTRYPPAKQIFDIPESHDLVTELTIVNMLHYSLEHADKNLPHKRQIAKKEIQSIHKSLTSSLAAHEAIFQHSSLL
ncbi:hypothetical protein NC651_007440 [Populus alba x Populus x berolinensis]|nr:hypothetical protein NC651_007440 [Populus alba x Populus x berolinensis]